MVKDLAEENTTNLFRRTYQMKISIRARPSTWTAALRWQPLHQQPRKTRTSRRALQGAALQVHRCSKVGGTTPTSAPLSIIHTRLSRYTKCSETPRHQEANTPRTPVTPSALVSAPSTSSTQEAAPTKSSPEHSKERQHSKTPTRRSSEPSNKFIDEYSKKCYDDAC